MGHRVTSTCTAHGSWTWDTRVPQTMEEPAWGYAHLVGVFLSSSESKNHTKSA